MKKILLSTNGSRARKILPFCLALLLLVGCKTVPAKTGTSALPPSSRPVTTSAPKVTTVEPSDTTGIEDAPSPDPKPLPEDAAYRWDPYCFDLLEGEYEADAKLLADAIMDLSATVTLSSPQMAQAVVDNFAFEFPPAALVNLSVAGDQVKITYLHSKEEHEKQLSVFETAVNRALSILSEEDGELRRATLLYDYVVRNVAYFTTDYTDKEITAFSALVAGETICYGFADAFGYLLRQTGMEAHLWRGGTYTFTGFSDHGWCYAKVAGNYYHFDPTWECSATKSSGKNNYLYFGLSDKGRFTSLSRTCVSGFGALEKECDVTQADDRLAVTGR